MLEVKMGTNCFYIGTSEKDSLAEITYQNLDENTIVADHTYVSEALNGKGAGKLLLKELVNWARLNNKKIKPVCSFVVAQMNKMEEYHDLIY